MAVFEKKMFDPWAPPSTLKSHPWGMTQVTELKSRPVILFGQFKHLIWESFPILKWPLFSQFREHVFPIL